MAKVATAKATAAKTPSGLEIPPVAVDTPSTKGLGLAPETTLGGPTPPAPLPALEADTANDAVAGPTGQVGLGLATSGPPAGPSTVTPAPVGVAAVVRPATPPVAVGTPDETAVARTKTAQTAPPPVVAVEATRLVAPVILGVVTVVGAVAVVAGRHAGLGPTEVGPVAATVPQDAVVPVVHVTFLAVVVATPRLPTAPGTPAATVPSQVRVAVVALLASRQVDALEMATSALREVTTAVET